MPRVIIAGHLEVDASERASTCGEWPTWRDHDGAMANPGSTRVRRLRARLLEQVAAPREVRSARTRGPIVAELLPKGGVGAELGVYKGRFSPVLLQASEAERLHLVDPWYLLTPEWHWGVGDRSTVNALRRILRRFRTEIEVGRVEVHVGNDLDVLGRMADHSLDWAYLDSSHAYEHTVDELALLDRKVRPGGVIAGDDWRPDPDHPHHGVHRAVTEFLQANGYELRYADVGNRQWAISRGPSSTPAG
jgi:Methyltransferase domain